MTPLRILSVLIVLACATNARAQSLTLELRDGVVRIDARGVSLRDIMRRWSDVGSVSIENVDVLSPAPLTLSLTGLTELQALRILLRDVSGYVVGQREDGSTGRGVIGRILIAGAGSSQGSSSPGTVRPATASSGFTVLGPSGFTSGSFNSGSAASPQVEQSSDRAAQADGANPGEPPQTNREFRPAPIRYLDAYDENGNRLRAPSVDANTPPQPTDAQKAPANPFGVTTAASTPGPTASPSTKR
jgi:hypothetical protein